MGKKSQYKSKYKKTTTTVSTGGLTPQQMQGCFNSALESAIESETQAVQFTSNVNNFLKLLEEMPNMLTEFNYLTKAVDEIILQHEKDKTSIDEQIASKEKDLLDYQNKRTLLNEKLKGIEENENDEEKKKTNSIKELLKNIETNITTIQNEISALRESKNEKITHDHAQENLADSLPHSNIPAPPY